MHQAQLHVVLFVSLLLGACAYALIRGGGPERTAAMIILVGSALTIALISPAERRFHNVEVGVTFADALILAALATLTVYANRGWPIWLTGMQAVAVMSHIPILLAPEVLPRAYGLMQALWSWPIMAGLVIGTHRHRLRKKRLGTDRSWRRSFGRSSATVPPAPPRP